MYSEDKYKIKAMYLRSLCKGVTEGIKSTEHVHQNNFFLQRSNLVLGNSI